MNHEHDDQSRRTLGATVAKCPELVTPDLDRVRCSCGQPRPTDAGTDLVREYARLSLAADELLDLWGGMNPQQPESSCDTAGWQAYGHRVAEKERTRAAWSKANDATKEYRRANLAALRAALGVEP